MTIPAGMLAWRARFERRVAGADDGYGNVLRTWAAVATLACGFKPSFGGESVEAGRLQSTMRGVATLHASSLARGLRAEDRLIFLAGPYAGRPMQIRSIQPRPDAASIELACEEGVAT